MFERFTDRVRMVMAMANQEASRYGHESIGAEHILLGLLRGEPGGAAAILKHFDVDVGKLRLDVEEVVRATGGSDVANMGKLPQTPGAKKVIENAISEARSLDLSYVGTEHALLGLMILPDEVASQILTNAGLKIADVREAAKKLSVLHAKPEIETSDPRGSTDAFNTYYTNNWPLRLHIEKGNHTLSTIKIPQGTNLAIQTIRAQDAKPRTDHEFSGDLVVRIKKLAPGQEGACDELMADSPFELTLKDSVVKVEKII